MCVPHALVIPLLIGASAAASGAGVLMSASAQARQARYQADVAEQNKAVAEGQAKDSIENTNLEAQRRYRELAHMKGAQTAALAANGTDMNFGSAADLQQDTALIGSEDIAQIYKGGNERTKGFEISAYNYQASANADRAKAKGAITQGIFGAFGTALGAASQFAGMKGGGGKSSGMTGGQVSQAKSAGFG